MTKFCKDCKWCELIVTHDSVDYSKCHNPAIWLGGEVSLVTGNKTNGLLPYCESQRTHSDGKCGRDAALFESAL